jgi:hypothetical protein
MSLLIVPTWIASFNVHARRGNLTRLPQKFTAAETQITDLACVQKVQALNTAVALLLLDLIVDRTSPPRLDEQMDALRWQRTLISCHVLLPKHVRCSLQQ